MAGSGCYKRWWSIMVLIAAFGVAVHVGLGAYMLIRAEIRGPMPPDRYGQHRRAATAGVYMREDARGRRAVVWVDGHTVLAFRSDFRGRSMRERAEHAADVINEFLDRDTEDVEVRVGHDTEGQYAVRLDGEIVAVADYTTAQANGSTTRQLARMWVASLQSALEPGRDASN
jgi:hypothetical protein